MHAGADRLEFEPPPTAGLLRALALAVLAHGALVAALTWGLHWKRSAEIVTAQAELWATVPQQAAPKAVEPPPPPPPPVPVPTPVPPPPQPAPPEPVAPKVTQADIALEREKQRLKKEKQQAAEKLEREKREQRRLAQEQLELEKRRLAAQKQREQDEKLAQEKKNNEQEAKRKEALKVQEEARKLEQQRQANLQRMAGLALGSGAPGATGTAQQSAGPSAGYQARVSAKVRPNIVLIEEIAGNPTADVEVRAAADGTILSRRLVKTSGNKAWDEAVLKAIDKTESLPRDVDGRVPSPLVIGFRPKD